MSYERLLSAVAPGADLFFISRRGREVPFELTSAGAAIGAPAGGDGGGGA